MASAGIWAVPCLNFLVHQLSTSCISVLASAKKQKPPFSSWLFLSQLLDLRNGLCPPAKAA